MMTMPGKVSSRHTLTSADGSVDWRARITHYYLIAPSMLQAKDETHTQHTSPKERERESGRSRFCIIHKSKPIYGPLASNQSPHMPNVWRPFPRLRIASHFSIHPSSNTRRHWVEPRKDDDRTTDIHIRGHIMLHNSESSAPERQTDFDLSMASKSDPDDSDASVASACILYALMMAKRFQMVTGQSSAIHYGCALRAFNTLGATSRVISALGSPFGLNPWLCRLVRRKRWAVEMRSDPPDRSALSHLTQLSTQKGSTP